MVNITHVDLLALATSYQYNYMIQSIANASTDHVSFISYDNSFVSNILGPKPTQELVITEPWAAFHEAGVYNQATGKVCFLGTRSCHDDYAHDHQPYVC